MSGLGSIGRFVRGRKCDTQIEVNGSIFTAHKVVLQEHSSFFKKKIAQNGNQTNIVVDNVTVQGMEWCIDFMYTGNCPPKLSSLAFNLSDISGAVQTADVLQMEHLKATCLQLIQRNMTPQNCLEAVTIFRKYCKARVHEAQTYVKDNLGKVICQKDFIFVSEDDFFKYISGADPQVAWNAITLWVEHQPQRHRHLYKALDILLNSKLDLLPIMLQVNEYHLISQEPSCMERIVMEAECRESRWIHNMTADSSIKLLKLLTSVNLPNQRVAARLERAITEYLESHVDEAKDRYNDLSLEDFKTAISCIKFKTQVQWEYIVSWIKKGDSRTNHLLELIKVMDTNALTSKFISDHMRDIIKSSNDCLNYILDCLLKADSTKQSNSITSLAVFDSKTEVVTLIRTLANTYSEVKSPPAKGVSRIASIAGELFLHSGNSLYKLTIDGTWLKLSHIPDYSQSWTQLIAQKNQLLIISSKTTFQYTINTKVVKYHSGCSLGNGFSATCSDLCIFAVGGAQTHNHAKQCTLTNGWTDLPVMPIYASYPASTYFKNKLYVMGGSYAGSNSNSVACFDGTTWVSMSSMLRRRSQFSAMVYNSKILVVGGSSGLITPFEDVEEYDHNTKSWKQIGLINATKGVVSLGVCEVDKTSVPFKGHPEGTPPMLFIAGRMASRTTI